MRTTTCLFTALAAVLCAVNLSSAASIDIQLTDVDIEFDGTDITNVGPGSDSLSLVNFLLDGSSVGTTSGTGLDLVIPNVDDILATGDTVLSDAGGTLGLDFGSAGSLLLELDEVTVSFIDIAGIAQFAFAATAASVSTQDLPFGLEIIEPITVSFSTPIESGTLTDDGTFVTGFVASGTGEISATFVPEPTSIAMVSVLAGLAVTCTRMRRS